MSETPTYQSDPAAAELVPRLLPWEQPLISDSGGVPVIDATAWGVWSPPGDGVLLAAGGPLPAAVWAPSDDSDGSWRQIADGSIRRDEEGYSRRVGERMDWGAWGTIDGGRVLALGGTWWNRPEDAGLWLWSDSADTLVKFETGPMGLPGWGAWGQLEGRAVLATGHADGWMRLWDPRTRTEITAIEVDDAGNKVHWGGWGEVNGRPLLVAGTDAGTQAWSSADILQNSSRGLTPAPLSSAGSSWGAWTQIDGASVLAIGQARGSVQLVDYGGRSLQVPEFFPAPSPPSGPRRTWGTWVELRGEPLLAVGDQDGNLWFCNPHDGSIRTTSLGRAVQWMSWGRVGGQPVLAAGGDRGAVLRWDLVWERVVSRVPRYSSDSGAVADQLGRRQDAAALADVITARSARPPLAVGVFGQWGDGKSIFLEMLQEQVRERARVAGPDDPIAHGEVRQVRFNAWHYAEADLWASLVAELFAQLNQEDPQADPSHEQRQRSRLASELVQARGLREQLAAATERLADLRKANGSTNWNALTPAAKRELRMLFGVHTEESYERFATTMPTLRATRRSLRLIAGALPRRIWLWAGVAALLTVALIAWGPGAVRWIGALPPIAVIVLAAGDLRTGWERTKPTRDHVAAGWRFLKQVRQEQKRRLETAEAVAAAEVAELRTRLQNLTSAGQLAGVVEERAEAGSYRERLGLMTEIRQDFERMADLLQPDQLRDADVPEMDAAGDKLPAIDRIVVYIDDLDRCPPDRVVEVLEAVHLLLAVRLFVVVVAVDPRWLLRSLTSHYQELFVTAGPMTDEDEVWASTPAQYLEKIFQIVLTLPPMEQDGYRRMIDDLVDVRKVPGANEGGLTDQDVVAEEYEWTADSGHVFADERGISVDHDQASRRPVDLTARVVDRVDPLALTPSEYDLINLLGPPLISGPRSVKRLANSYGLLVSICAPEELYSGLRPDLIPVPDLGGTVPPYRAGMVLLAAVIGFPMLGPDFFPDLFRTARSNPELPWRDYLRGLRPKDGLGNRAAPTMTAARAAQWSAFLDALEVIGTRADNAAQPLPHSLAIWAKWVVPVGRLSFPTGSAVGRLAGF